MNPAQDHRYLIYRIGSDLYGSPLLTIREVIEFQKPKFMPNMASYFSGIINIRGTIVGVVDLRNKFGLPEEAHPRMAMLLCDTESGPIAAVVDEVECVTEIVDEDLELSPPVQTRVAQNYLMGVAKNKGNLITIINLHQSLQEDNLKAG